MSILLSSSMSLLQPAASLCPAISPASKVPLEPCLGFKTCAGNTRLGIEYLCSQLFGTPINLNTPVQCSNSNKVQMLAAPVAFLSQDHIVWVARNLVFYTLLQVGFSDRPTLQSVSALPAWVPSWARQVFGEDNDNHAMKHRNKWHKSTKGTLVRRYRVPSKSHGRKLLDAISSLLSNDDSFRDASSHKGCQIRRENAHAESVCCNNVRALLDELPTPHLVVEITVFPAGPITEIQYEKADKLEEVLRTGISI